MRYAIPKVLDNPSEARGARGLIPWTGAGVKGGWLLRRCVGRGLNGRKRCAVVMHHSLRYCGHVVVLVAHREESSSKIKEKFLGVVLLIMGRFCTPPAATAAAARAFARPSSPIRRLRSLSEVSTGSEVKLMIGCLPVKFSWTWTKCCRILLGATVSYVCGCVEG